MNPADALSRVRESGADFTHLQFTDILGAVKGVTIPSSRLETALSEGIWFDGSSVEGWARVAESDLYLKPDPASLTIFPWESPPAARFMCDLGLPGGEPFAGDPRQALRRVLEEAAAAGFEYRVSAELEFFLLVDNRAVPLELARGLEPSDADSYYSLPTERTMRVCQLVAKTMEGAGFQVAATHHEVAPGQHEIDLGEHDALRAADAIATLKIALRACAQREHMLATFMPKPLASLSGSGLHFQQALFRPDGSNAFYEPSATYGLSADGRCFVAGQLAQARGLCALLAPLVNSYKRLSGGGEAPALIDWARINRGALIRVPEMGPSSGERMYVELRSADPSCNPYLALAAALKAGLEGMASQLDLPEPLEERQGDEQSPDGEADPLPRTLGEAIEELEWNPVVRAALGQAIYERYLAAKEQEWAAYRDHISLWELETYLQRA